jgi:DnaJ-class molecular chaperone
MLELDGEGVLQPRRNKMREEDVGAEHIEIVTCTDCGGEGCRYCGNQGHVPRVKDSYYAMLDVPCSRCKGSGSDPYTEEDCDECDGGFVPEDDSEIPF